MQGGTGGLVEDDTSVVGACADCNAVSEACRPAISDGEALKSAADTWLVVRYGCGRERDGSGGSGKEGALSGSGTGMPGGAPAGRADWRVGAGQSSVSQSGQ